MLGYNYLALIPSRNGCFFMKKCSKCKVEKLIKEYGKHKFKRDGLQTWCKNCHNLYTKKNVAHITELKRKWKRYIDNNKIR